MQEDKTKVFSYRNNGHGFMGSLNPLSLIYGDYHVIDKSTHNCHVLMVVSMTATCPKTYSWKKYSFVLLGHPRKASVVAVTPTSYFSLFTPR